MLTTLIPRRAQRSRKSTVLSALASVALAATAIGTSAGMASADSSTSMLRSWLYGTCIGATGADGSSGVFGAECNLRDTQQWTEVGVGSNTGLVKLKNKAMPWRCLDSNAAGQVYTTNCQAGNAYQEWSDVDFGGNVHGIENYATYNILTFADRAKLVTVTWDHNRHNNQDIKRGL